MKAKLLLRIAAGLMLFHALGHSMGMTQWDKPTDAEHVLVINSMKDHRFPFMGAVHSYADSFSGFGYAGTIAMLLITCLLWLTASFSNAQPQISTKILLLLFVSLVALCIMEFIYFFPLAAITTLLAAILTGVSILKLAKRGVAVT